MRPPETGKGSSERENTQCCSDAVLQSERGKSLDAEGKNIKCQSSNAK
jgi:hypothetical protein